MDNKGREKDSKGPGGVEWLGTPQARVLGAIALVFIILYTWGALLTRVSAPIRHTISYSSFVEQLETDKISSVTIMGLEVEGELSSEIEVPVYGQERPVRVKSFKTRLPNFQGEGLMERLRERNVSITVEPTSQESLLWQFVMMMLPWIIIIGIWVLLMRRSQQVQGGPGGLFSFGASKARLHDATEPGVSFADVAGMDNAKQELRETIEFLKQPDRFVKIGAKVPRGVLLVGPPGTGKTLLARATAGEAGVPFYSISASEFIEMFVGVGASRVRDMFKKAKATHPSIIFIDEIDAVGRTRGTGFGGGHDEREQTLNQLLSEMDGFDPHEETVVIAATNRPDVLDPALLRPGRFDRHIVIDRPGWKERRSILEVHVRDKKLAGDIDLEHLAKGTPGMTGADLENLANEAALGAIRKHKEKIDLSDFEEARDKLLMGGKREETISDIEKRITAYHESGHALVARVTPGTDPIHKVSIIARGMALGATLLLPEEDRHYYPKSYLKSRLSVMMAGRVAERLVFDDLSSGAHSDLKEATALAEKMVAQWGMSDKVGPVNLGRGEEHPFLGRELAQPKRYSEQMAWLMDQEIRRLIVEAEARAEDILKERRHVLDALAETLMVEETLNKEDIDRIIEQAAQKGGHGKGES